MPGMMPQLQSLLVLALILGNSQVQAYNPFFGLPKHSPDKPRLILISGCPGTGKSTFGMSVALDQGILKCVSTDTVRAVMRSFVAKEVSPALHRSSYAEAYTDDPDPVRSWKETCQVLEASVESLVDDAMNRKVSLVLEGVHVVPSTKLIKKWEESGGVALGVLLQIQAPDVHKRLLKQRGFTTGNVGAEEKKISSYKRIRAIQDEMMKLAQESNWLRIEQKTEPDPLDMVSNTLSGLPTLRQQIVFVGETDSHKTDTKNAMVGTDDKVVVEESDEETHTAPSHTDETKIVS